MEGVDWTQPALGEEVGQAIHPQYPSEIPQDDPRHHFKRKREEHSYGWDIALRPFDSLPLSPVRQPPS